MPELHETHMGRKYYEVTLPKLVAAIEELTRELKILNGMNLINSAKEEQDNE